jgi:ankyrin repeat protein
MSEPTKTTLANACRGIRPSTACLIVSTTLAMTLTACNQDPSAGKTAATSEATTTETVTPATTPAQTPITTASTTDTASTTAVEKPMASPIPVDLAASKSKPVRDARDVGTTVGPIKFSPDPLDLGELTAGVAKTATVTLMNESEEAVTITKAIPGCGCTTLGWPKDPIPPGGSADIDITLKPGPKQGIRLKKRVTFQIEGHPSQVLNVEGDVAAYVTIKPDIISARAEDANMSEDIVLASADGIPFKVIGIDPPVVLDADKESSLEHTMHLDWEAWEAANRPVKIAFKTDHPKASQVTALVKRRPNAPKLPNQPMVNAPSINDLSGAARAGDANRVKLLLAEGKDPNQSDAAGGRTALHWAVRNGNVEIVDILIKGGADLNKGDQAGKTALSHAAESGKVDLTRKLIESGADVNKRDLVGGNSVLWAAGLGNADTLAIVVEAGGNVDVKDINGLTPLQWAAQTGKTDSMKILIDGGADVNATDGLNGESVLMRAARSGKTESINLLLENGADPSIKTKIGGNALHISSEYSNVEIVKILVEGGLDPKAVDMRSPGWNALDYAKNRVDEGRFQVIAYLTPMVEEPATEEAPAADPAPAPEGGAE